MDLTYNKIRYISLNNAKDFFNHDSTNNVDILIDHNPLHCGCELYDYVLYLEGKMRPNIKKYINIDPKDLTCFTPPKWRDVRIKDLQSKSFTCTANNNIDASMCPDKCNCSRILEEQEFVIDCFRRNFTVVPSVENVPHKFWQIRLNLSDNQLTQMPNLTKLGYGPVSALILSDNNISEVPLDLVPKSLMVLKFIIFYLKINLKKEFKNLETN